MKPTYLNGKIVAETVLGRFWSRDFIVIDKFRWNENTNLFSKFSEKHTQILKFPPLNFYRGVQIDSVHEKKSIFFFDDLRVFFKFSKRFVNIKLFKLDIE